MKGLIVGFGTIARGVHLPVLQQLGVTTVDVIDPTPPPPDFPVRYLNTEEVTENYDVALVATPPRHHTQWIVRLAPKAKYILCEKPPTITLDGLRAAFNFCQAHGTRLLFGFHNCFRPSWQRFLEALGTLPNEVTISGWYRRRDGIPPTPWHRDFLQGGVWRDLGSHILSLTYDVLQPKEFAEVTGASLYQLPEGADYAAAVSFTVDSKKATILASWKDLWGLEQHESVGLLVEKEGLLLGRWVWNHETNTITAEVNGSIVATEPIYGLHPYTAEWETLLSLPEGFKDLRAVWVQHLLEKVIFGNSANINLSFVPQLVVR